MYQTAHRLLLVNFKKFIPLFVAVCQVILYQLSKFIGHTGFYIPWILQYYHQSYIIHWLIAPSKCNRNAQVSFASCKLLLMLKYGTLILSNSRQNIILSSLFSICQCFMICEFKLMTVATSEGTYTFQLQLRWSN
jgi:hypothetical protein